MVAHLYLYFRLDLDRCLLVLSRAPFFGQSNFAFLRPTPRPHRSLAASAWAAFCLVGAGNRLIWLISRDPLPPRESLGPKSALSVLLRKVRWERSGRVLRASSATLRTGRPANCSLWAAPLAAAQLSRAPSPLAASANERVLCICPLARAGPRTSEREPRVAQILRNFRPPPAPPSAAANATRPALGVGPRPARPLKSFPELQLVLRQSREAPTALPVTHHRQRAMAAPSSA